MSDIIPRSTTLSLRAPERICVIGSPGSGKTTLSRVLKEALNLPLIRMSDVRNEMDGTLGPNASAQERITYIEHALSNHTWITDGYFSASLDVRFHLADLIIFLDLPMQVCLFSVFTRSWKNLFGIQGTSHGDYAATLQQRFGYFFRPRIYRRVISFHLYKRPLLLQTLKSWSETKTVLILKSRSEANMLASSKSWPYSWSEREQALH